MAERERAITVVDQRRDRLVDVPADAFLVGVRRYQASGNGVRDRRERLKRGYVQCRGRAVFARVGESLVAIIDQRRNRLVDIPNHTILIGIGRNRVARDELRNRRQRLECGKVERGQTAVFMSEGHRLVAVIDERCDRLIDIEGNTVLIGVRTNEIALDGVRQRSECLQCGQVQRARRPILVGERDRLITVVYERRDRLVDIGRYAIFIDVRRNRVASNRVGHAGQRFERSSVERGRRSVLVREAKCAIAVVYERGNGLINVPANPFLIDVGGDRIADDHLIYRRERLQ